MLLQHSDSTGHYAGDFSNGTANVEDRGVAAQRRAEELVARLRGGDSHSPRLQQQALENSTLGGDGATVTTSSGYLDGTGPSLPIQSSASPRPLHYGTEGSGSEVGLVLAATEGTRARGRAQVVAELDEAIAMMNGAKTPEAASFWRSHAESLRERLRVLGGDEVPDVSPPAQPPAMPATLPKPSPVPVPDPLATPASMPPGIPLSGRPWESPQRPPAMRTTTDYDWIHDAASGGGTISRPMQQQQQQQQQQEQPSHLYGRSTELPPPASAPAVYGGPPVADVIAPADLPGGYTFEAQMGNMRFLATVPSGGVRRGDRFATPVKGGLDVDVTVPVGRWRDGLFNLFQFGVLHPLLLNSVFVPLHAIGQIMSRNGLNSRGDPATRLEAMAVTTNILVVIMFWALMNIVVAVNMGVNRLRGKLPAFLEVGALVAINLGTLCFTVYAVVKTRRAVRERYGIPSACGNVEDAAFAIFCMPCTITQIGRHTADFETHRAVCCSKTGVSDRDVDLVPDRQVEQSTQAGCVDPRFLV